MRFVKGLFIAGAIAVISITIYMIGLGSNYQTKLTNSKIEEQFRTEDNATLCYLETGEGMFDGLSGIMYVKNEDIPKLESNVDIKIKLYAPLDSMPDEYINLKDISKVRMDISKEEFVDYVKEYVELYQKYL